MSKRSVRIPTVLLALCLVAAGASVPADSASPLTSHERNYLADLAGRTSEGAVPDDVCWLHRSGFEPVGTPSPRPPPLILTTDAGYRIHIDRHQIVITDPSGRNKVEHWGDPHENLNGKHIKDWGGATGWDGTRRSILLGDGSKVTMAASGAQGVVVSTSIYDGARNVQVDNCHNAIVHADDDPLDTAQRDLAQYDGETASFTTDAATGVARYDNVGNEDAAFDWVATPQPLGTTGGLANPTQVNDFFDDPRLGHT